MFLFLEIHKYAELDLLKALHFFEFEVYPDTSKPKDFLASLGLRTLIKDRGFQSAIKLFPSATRPQITAKYLKPASRAKIGRLSQRMNKRIDEWLHDRIRHPRHWEALAQLVGIEPKMR